MSDRLVGTAPEGPEGYVRSMEVRVLGPVDVRVDGESLPLGGVKQRALLALLIAGVPDVVSVDRLIEGIWGEEPTRGARSTLQTYVSNLRQTLGDVITHERGGYRLDIDPDLVDAVVFARALERARTGVATDPAATAADLRSSLATWRGLPYADLLSVPGLDAEVRRLEELRLEAVELRIDAELASGHHTDLIAELEALAEEHPTRERFRAQHMLALYRSGRQAEALRAYRRTEEYLAEELGVDPSPELRDLELRILEHDESLLMGQSRSVTQRLAFMVTDIEGSTRLWDEFPHAMAGALAIHDRLMGEAIEASGGRVFKHTGDGVLAVFGEATAAVAAAEQAQRALVEYPWEGIDPLEVRMGIDVGEAEARDNDFFGPPLNRAARLCAIAHGGQVLVSASVTPEVMASAPAGLQIRNLGEVHLRGMATPERVSQMVFVGLPADFPPPRSDTGGVLDERVVVALPGYEVREKIGEGAFGVVWRAYQPSVGREVAVKVIRPELASQPSFVRRFEAEARTVARLAHPHIVPLIDFWRDTDGAYLVLGLLPGGSLERVLATGEVEVDAARRILLQVGSALDHAHSQNLAHGDLKPANVLLDGAGNAYLSDFGIPTRLMDRETITSIESAPEYRAPEMPETGPTPEADRYALGMLARSLLDGAPEIVPVLSRATAANPSDRYPNAAAFLADLDSALGDLRAGASPPVASRNPFKGLRAFDEADAADFYGRGDLVSALLAAVTRHRFVAVVGPSGSGKSSVVRAGLLPALAAGRVDGMDTWFHAVFTPGPRPMESMVEALERVLPRQPRDTSSQDLTEWLRDGTAGAGAVMVVDQFEEIYTQVEEPDRRRRFVEMLMAIVEDEGLPVRVVATLRADFYDRPLTDGRLGPLVRSGQVTVLPPTRDELVEMITGPSQAVGLRWEPGLPHRITEDVAHQSGSLPLLQYALTELVERRENDLLTGADYERIGEVAGALAGRAEAISQGFDPPQQAAVRQVLLRLVTVDEESDDTRRRVRRSELESLGIDRHHLDAVLDALVKERLLLADRDPVTRGPTIEVAHEALLREWPRLAGWIDEQREALILGRRLRAALDEWEASGRDDDYLLTGGRLAPFIGWAETVALTDEERAFYQASRAKDDTARRARRRRRRTLTGVLGGATVVASVLGVVAAIQAAEATRQAERADAEAAIAIENEAEAERQAESARKNAEEAEEARREAEEAALLARSRELAAASMEVRDEDAELSVLLGLEALAVAPNDDLPQRFIDSFRSAIHSSRVTLRRPLTGEPEIPSIALSPDGSRVAVTTDAARLEMWDSRSSEVVWHWEDETRGGWFSGIDYSPDGERLAVAYNRYWSEARLVDGGITSGIYILSVLDGEILATVSSRSTCPWIGLPEGRAFVENGDSLVTISDLPDADGGCQMGQMSVEVVNSVTGEIVESYPASNTPYEDWGAFLTVAPDPSGAAVVISDRNEENQPRTRGLSRGSGEVLWESPFTVAGYPSPDGSVVALMIPGPGQTVVEVRDAATGEVIGELYEPGTFAVDLTFNQDGSRLYMALANGRVSVWDVTTGARLTEYTAGMESVSLSGDEALIAGESSGDIVVVDLSAQPLGEVMAYDFSPYQLASWGLDAAESVVAIQGFYGRCPEQYAAIRLVDASSGTVLHNSHDLGGQTLALTPDGSRVVYQQGLPDDPDVPCSERETGTIVMRDAATGVLVGELDGLCVWFLPGDAGCVEPPNHPYAEFVQGMDVSPDGSRLAAGGGSGHVSIWDLGTGQILATLDPIPGNTLEEPETIFGVALHPRSEVAAFATSEREARLVVMSFDGAVIHQEAVEGSTLDFSVDGEHLYVGLRDGKIRAYETDAWTSEEVGSHQGGITDMDLSPDGSLLVTGGFDGFVRVWDAHTHELRQEIGLEGDFAKGLAFVDDSHIALGTQGGLVAVLTLDLDELAEIGRSRLSRGFTEEECVTYLGLEACPTEDTQASN